MPFILAQMTLLMIQERYLTNFSHLKDKRYTIEKQLPQCNAFLSNLIDRYDNGIAKLIRQIEKR